MYKTKEEFANDIQRIASELEQSGFKATATKLYQAVEYLKYTEDDHE